MSTVIMRTLENELSGVATALKEAVTTTAAEQRCGTDK
jgi:hypothetical protein